MVYSCTRNSCIFIQFLGWGYFFVGFFHTGNGADKILYGRTSDELLAPANKPRLQRQRSLKMFHGVGTSKRLSWSEYRLSGITSGGSLKLSQAKAKKLMDECAMSHVSDWDEATTVLSNDETNAPIKTHKGQRSFQLVSFFPYSKF